MKITKYSNKIICDLLAVACVLTSDFFSCTASRLWRHKQLPQIKTKLRLPFLFIFILACSPREKWQKPQPFAEPSFSLFRKGEKMPVYVLGNPAAEKILLILHGGPGGNMSDYEHLKPLADEFLIVGFEQRGSDYTEGTRPENIALSDFADDIAFLISEIKTRFKGKLYLYAGSFGAYVFSQYAEKYGINEFNALIFSMGVTYSPIEALKLNLKRLKADAAATDLHLSPQHTKHCKLLTK